MKYRLTKDCLGYKKGQDFEVEKNRIVDSDKYTVANHVETLLLLETGILEEVKEEEWPTKGDSFYWVDDEGLVLGGTYDGYSWEKRLIDCGNYFRTK